MARVILGYDKGKPVWSENEPAKGRVAGYGGSAVNHAVTLVFGALVTGGPGSMEQARITNRAYRKRKP